MTTGERTNLRAVMCRDCGHSYPDHYQGAGPCSVWCGCPAFRWVDPTGPAGGYSSPPGH